MDEIKFTAQIAAYYSEMEFMSHQSIINEVEIDEIF